MHGRRFAQPSTRAPPPPRPRVMAEAKQLLKSAESHLRRGDYRAARDEAELARTKAVEARGLAEAAKAPKQP